MIISMNIRHHPQVYSKRDFRINRFAFFTKKSILFALNLRKRGADLSTSQMLAFPALKIGLLFVKQISKPIANYVKNQAKQHPNMKATVIRFAQGYHRLEVRMKRREMASDAAKVDQQTIRPLDDAR